MDGHLEPFRESLCTRTHDTSDLAADYIEGLIKAERGDRWGNLTYRMAARNFGPVMAMAAKRTVASLHEIAELGALDPKAIPAGLRYWSL